ncbi:hypothetical protein [Cloacibacterium sp.]|uniref:hypothetical protein n=1 Tax=Cloacibacterium sp. TaxID=1913682 RepID=UPI0039E23E4F
MKRNIFTTFFLTILFSGFSSFSFAQEGNNSVKFNLGTSFSKQADELAKVAMDGKNMQLSVSAMFDFGKFKWTNGNGSTSSFKMSKVGFGVQYNF